MGIGKSRDGYAVLIDAHDPRIRIEREVKGLGRRYLRHKANIRDGRPVAVAEVPARRMFGEQRLNRLQASAEPMLDPGKSLLVADLKHVRKVMPNARHDQRVRVGRIDQGDSAYPGPRLRIGWQ